MTISRIAGILIEQGCEERPLVAEIVGRLPGVPVALFPMFALCNRIPGMIRPLRVWAKTYFF